MNVFDLVAKLALDKNEYEAGLSSAENQASTFAGGVSKVMGTVGKATVAALGTAATAVGALTKQAVESYADYEQLVGGIETLFGAQGQSLSEYAQSVGQTVEQAKSAYDSLMTAQETVMTNASNAYKTAGLSANDYMETVTSFAASLVSSLDGDTEAAAKAADQAIVDMSDNANKMGTSMESIQNAYKGFAKQNYTMLDNLSLGYGGTKEEMERLLEDAEKLPEAMGKDFDISNYADVVEAIHLIQENMGIAGTTAKEASSTISGSLGMVKAAWANLLTGVADDDADFSALIDNMVESVTAFGSNIIPRIETAIAGVGDLITGLLPPILEELPNLISTVLPELLESGVQLISTLGEGIVEALPQLLETATDIILQLMDSLGGMLPQIWEAGFQILTELLQGITEAMPQLTEKAVEIITNLAQYIQENLPQMIETALVLIQNFATTLAENAPLILDAGIQLLMALVNGIVEAMPALIEMLPTIISTFANVINDNMPTIIAAGLQIITALVQGLVDNIPLIIACMPQIIAAIWDTICAINWLNLGKNIMTLFKNGITGMKSAVGEAGKNLIENFKNGFKDLPSKLAEFGKQAIEGFIKGIVDNIGQAVNTAVKAVGSVVSAIQTALGIHSPSKVFASIGGYMVAGLEKGWDDSIDDARKDITDGMTFDTVPIATSKSSSGISSATMDQILAKLDALANQNIVLDTGALVGQTVGAYDTALGRKYAQQARYV